MATTFVEYTGDGNATKQFTFPSVQESDVKVRVDGVLKTTSTHYNITSYTTTGGGNVVFTSGNIPSSPANIRIYRDTNVDAPKATFTAGSSVKAADLNNNTTQLLYRAQEEQSPNLIHTYDIDTDAIETSNIKNANVTEAKLADSSVTEAKLAANSVTTPKILNRTITAEKIAGNSITTSELGNSCVEANELANNAVVTAKIQNDAVTTEKIADGAVTAAKIAGNSITTSQLGNSSVDSNELANNAVVNAKIANNAVTAAKIADRTITAVKIAGNSITTSELANSSVDSNELANGAVVTAKIATGAVTSGQLGDDAVITAKIADNAVTSAQIAADAVGSGEISDDAINSEHYVDGSIDAQHLATDSVIAVKIASNAVTVDKIADAELTTLSGMQSATASKLADSTALTADIADLNQIDGMAKETTITNDDTKFPTSGAVVDFVAAQLEPFGGFEAVATEVAFPNTQPVSGVVISIGDAGGVVVNGSGTSTTGRTVGGTTVTINNFPASLHSKTMAADIGLMVTSTGSGQVYNYHKILAKEADVEQLSNDINDFAARYRVGSSNPTSALDAGDLFFNTSTSKLLVYNATNTAWEEAQSIGNFFINTISSSSASGGGSPTPNGTAHRFTLSDAGAVAQQHIVSVDGVIQKPNSGASQPSEGFAIDGSDIIFGSAPVNGASLFVITCGSTVNVGTPGNNTVSSSELQNGSVINSKLATDAVTNNKVSASAAIAGTKISPDFGSQDITTTGDLTVSGGDFILNGTFPNIRLIDTNNDSDYRLTNANGTYEIHDISNSATRFSINQSGTVNVAGNLDVGAGIDVTGNITVTGTVDGVDIAALNTTVGNINTDVVTDTTPQLGGDLGSNGNDIVMADNDKIKVGNGSDLQIFRNSSSQNIIDNVSGNLLINHGTERHAVFAEDGQVELYHDNSKKFETTSIGTRTTGVLQVTDATSADAGNRISVGTSQDIRIYHIGGNDSYIRNYTGDFYLQGNNSGTIVNNIKFENSTGATEIYYNGAKKFETLTGGAKVTGNFIATGDILLDSDSNKLKIGTGDDLQIYHDGANSVIKNSTGSLFINATSSEVGAKIIPNEAVELYYDNSKKFETTSTGVKCQTNLLLNDGGQIEFQNSVANRTSTIRNSESSLEANIMFRTQTSGGGADRWEMTKGGNFIPAANNTYDIGSTTNRVRNIYTNDLNMSNEGSYNDVDGTWGDWTIQEGESDLFLKNNRSGKKYKFNLTEVS